MLAAVRADGNAAAIVAALTQRGRCQVNARCEVCQTRPTRPTKSQMDVAAPVDAESQGP